jgi:hypothetical protein
MDILNIIERIKLFPNAKVDRNYGQGREAVQKQLSQILEEEDRILVDKFIAFSQERMATLVSMISPHSLPKDYHLFLEYYGGLAIDYKDGTPFLNVFGIGPAVDGWYADVVACNEDSSDETIEQLYIGVWDNPVEGKKPDRIRFYLDLADDVQRHSILVPDRDNPPIFRKVANSFTEWLEQIAVTGGTLGVSSHDEFQP